MKAVQYRTAGAGPEAIEVRVPEPAPELIDVVGLARQGLVSSHVKTYSIEEAPSAYERLHAGEINGRAVVLPHG